VIDDLALVGPRKWSSIGPGADNERCLTCLNEPSGDLVYNLGLLVFEFQWIDPAKLSG